MSSPARWKRSRPNRKSYNPSEAFKGIDFGSTSGSDAAEGEARKSEAAEDSDDDSASEFEVVNDEGKHREAESSTESDPDVLRASSESINGQEPPSDDEDSIVYVAPLVKTTGAAKLDSVRPTGPKVVVVPSASAPSKNVKAKVNDQDTAIFNRYHARQRIAGQAFMSHALSQNPGEPVRSPIMMRNFGSLADPSPTRILNHPFTHPAHSSPTRQNSSTLRPTQDLTDRDLLYGQLCAMFTAPMSTLVEDLSWSKKISASHAVTSDKVDLLYACADLSFDEACAYFPRASQSFEQNVDHETDLESRLAANGVVTCSVCSSDKREPRRAKLEPFSAVAQHKLSPGRPGYCLNAGAPVWTLDWLAPPFSNDHIYEYLAVGTMTAQPAFGEFTRSSVSEEGRPVQSMLQIWCIDCSNTNQFKRKVTDSDGENEISLQLGICVDVGEAWYLQWCPDASLLCGESSDSILGLLAGLFSDGKIHIFAVPLPDLHDPSLRYIHSQPLCTLELPNTSMTTFEWASRERVVAGTETGFIAIWDIPALSAHLIRPRPSFYFAAHASACRRISMLQMPTVDGDFNTKNEEEPVLFGSVALDGSLNLCDLRDPTNVQTILHERGAYASLDSSSYLGAFVFGDQEFCLSFESIRPRSFAVHLKLALQSGYIHDVALSAFHPFAASVSADGTCIVHNVVRQLRNRRHATHLVNTIYVIHYDRHTGEYRMLDNIRPEQSAAKEGVSKKVAADNTLPIGAWPAEVGVHCAKWCKSLQRCAFLASGTASGLVRVDWVVGPDKP